MQEYMLKPSSNKTLVYKKGMHRPMDADTCLKKVSSKGLWVTWVQSMIHCYVHSFYPWTIRVQYLLPYVSKI